MKDAVLKDYRTRTPESEKLFERAKKVMAGGVCHNIRYFPPYPFYIKEARGSKVWDVDGNEYIDLWMAHYEAILGHSPEIIVNEVSRILSKGMHWGLVNEYQVELAELICQVVPSAEKVRFCCSGTEATMYAVRLARAFTGKSVILKVEGGWHGANTDLSVAIHSPYEEKESAGLLPEVSRYTKSIPFNDVEGSLRIMRQNAENLAAVLIEPVPGQGYVPAESGYLEALREEARKLDALLIFDEVIDGFRLSLGGAQEKYGITPDLTTLGKILGG
ncbi:aminotransferase class III-fold pyridoxal phosphate-dependent enzyme, partial [Candidatus Aerophobetes bacterium]